MSGPDPDVMAAIERGNAVVFFDVGLGDGANVAKLGRIKIELFVNDVSTYALLSTSKFYAGLTLFFQSFYSVLGRVKTFVNSVLVSWKV